MRPVLQLFDTRRTSANHNERYGNKVLELRYLARLSSLPQADNGFVDVDEREKYVRQSAINATTGSWYTALDPVVQAKSASA